MNGYTGDQNATCYGCGAGGYNPTTQTPLSTAMPNSTSAQSPLPTGIPTGPTYSASPFTMQFPQQQGVQGAQSTNQMPSPPSDMLAPITALNQPVPITTQSLQYINGFLRTMIGRKVTVDFLIGTGTLVDKTGTLLGVGANYILLNELETDDLLICDFYSIKFIRIYY